MFGFFNKKKAIEIKSPFIGNCVNVSEVPDEVFASNMVGLGIGFEPQEGVLYSPVNGEIIQVFPTKHAAIVKSEEGLEILLHVGIETVTMKGEGFESYVNKGDKVKEGDKIISFDISLINEKAKSVISPMVITNKEIIDSIEYNYGATKKNSTIAKIILK